MLVPDVEIINTTVSARHRTISLLLASGVTDRYALIRRPNGEVYWSLDSFTREDGGGPLRWAGHGGRVTVADVIARVPAAARDILRWTREEIEDGPDVYEIDLFSRENRRRSLERLAAELEAADPGPAAGRALS